MKKNFQTLRLDDLTGGINVRDYESEIEDKQGINVKNLLVKGNKLISGKGIEKEYNSIGKPQGITVNGNDVYYIEGGNILKNGVVLHYNNIYTITFSAIKDNIFSLEVGGNYKSFYYTSATEELCLSSLKTDLESWLGATYIITRVGSVITINKTDGSSFSVTNPNREKKILVTSWDVHSKIDIIIDGNTYTFTGDAFTFDTDIYNYLNTNVNGTTYYKKNLGVGGFILSKKDGGVMTITSTQYNRYTYTLGYKYTDTANAGQYHDYTNTTIDGTTYYFYGSQGRPFNGDKILRNIYGYTDDSAHGISFGSTTSQTSSDGFTITSTMDLQVNSITKHASCTATRARLFNNGGSVLATATFSGNTATFSSAYTISKNTTYRVELDNSGSTYTTAYTSGTSFPYTGEFITYTNKSGGGVGSASNITSINTTTIKLPSTFTASVVYSKSSGGSDTTWTNANRALYFSSGFYHTMTIYKNDYSTFSISSINHYTVPVSYPDDSALTSISSATNHLGAITVTSPSTVTITPDNIGPELEVEGAYDIYVYNNGIALINKLGFNPVLIDTNGVATIIPTSAVGSPRVGIVYKGKFILGGYPGKDNIIFSKTEDIVAVGNELSVFNTYSAGGQSVSAGNRGNITGMQVGENGLYVFKDNEIWYSNSEKDTGTSFNFIFNKLTNNGAVNQQSIVNIGQETFYFDFTNRAVRRLSYEQNLTTLKDTAISDEIRPILEAIPDDDEGNDIRYSGLINMSYTYPYLEVNFADVNAPDYYLNVGDDNYRYKLPNRTFVYHVDSKSWTERTDKNVLNKRPLFSYGKYYLANNGDVYKSFDDVTSLEQIFESKLYTFGDDVMYKKLGRLDIVGKSLGTSNVIVEIYMDNELVDEREFNFTIENINKKIDLYDIGQGFRFKIRATGNIELYDVQMLWMPTNISPQDFN